MRSNSTGFFLRCDCEICFLMSFKKIKVLSWNYRGLGSLEKCLVIRNVIRSSRCDVVCLQEMKLSSLGFAHVSTMLPSFFQTQCAFIDAIGSAGGCIIAWKRSYLFLSSWSTTHSISVLLLQINSGKEFEVTNVYGPSRDDDKLEFIREIRSLANNISKPWIIIGDFNLVRWLVDRTGDMRGFGLMSEFNDLIAELQLIDVPIKNRRFTWSNKRPVPTMSKLDRAFVTQEWSDSFPSISLSALEVIVSDHAPLLLTCKQLQTSRKQHKFENFWLSFPQVKDIVRRMWQLTDQARPNPHLLYQRIMLMHQQLRVWHLQSHSQLDKDLMQCKESILTWDQLEESRPLSQSEFYSRQMWRERAYVLANIIETRWRQRSRCRWLSEGDNNTKFFHNYASARHRSNTVHSLVVNGQQVDDPVQVCNLFLDHMRSILGTQATVEGFDPTVLYENDPNLNALADPFTEHEIENIVFHLANNRASGPDGLPSEFAKTYWAEIKHDIIGLLHDFHNEEIDLTPLNTANIVMIPKRHDATDLKDFRPISIISLIPKIISKLLATRLSVFLSQIISINQSAFIKGCQISENFLVVREILHHVSHSRQAAVFFKIDFAKTFDSINWEFLIHVMHSRGFPSKWIRWIKVLLQTSTSRVIINGEESEFFSHKRGLRQGDPLSPMLFLIAADVLQRMITRVNGTLDMPISPKLESPILAFQYADDTAIIAHADLTTMVTLKLILRLFSKVSGLQINFDKSSFYPINLDPDETLMVAVVMQCNQTQLPISYLGMPLTIRKPCKQDFIPLIEKIEARIEGWTAKLLSKGGRVQLINSVLSSVPIYLMTCFELPKWVVKRIEALCRNFLWGKAQNKGIPLISWEVVCLPKSYGGLGVANLQFRNKSLLLRWWWKATVVEGGLWYSVIHLLRKNKSAHLFPKIWLLEGSFFWNQLIKLYPLFQ